MQSKEIQFIDTHCHLYVPEFDPDRAEMIQRAIASGVNQMMMPNIDEESIPSLLSLAEEYPEHCFPMMGLHPTSVKSDYRQVLKKIEEKIFSGKFIGVGETGIDLYWDKTFKREQIDAFQIQISWAKDLDLPVIIHSRESLDLNIEIITGQQDGRLRGIFHCFGGSEEQANAITELGFKIGIGGVITYKNSGLADTLSKVSSSILVLETDAPYLTPVPYRGKRNESAYLTLVAQKLADTLQITLAEVAELTTRNAWEVFGKKG